MDREKSLFEIALKPGTSSMAGAYIRAYHKSFKGHRFLWSTGIEVKRKGFKPSLPGSVLKGLLKVAETAYRSLQEEGTPITNATLKHRIELIRDRIKWADNELSIWDGTKSTFYTIPDTVDKATLEAELKKELLKQQPNFKKVVDGVLSNGTNGLFGFWQSILDGKVKPRSGDKLRKSTIGVKRQTMTLVKEYNPLASFEKMDMAFYNGFTLWLSEEKKFDSNTVGKHVRQLKAVLHLAYRNELMDNDRFRLWPVMQEKNEVVTLSKDELLKIVELKKIGDKEISGTIDEVRDIFVLACFLGPRISDFKSFKSESLSTQGGVVFFEYVQEKTGALCKIPIHPIARAILDKRNGQFPKMISEQNFRYYLKDICQAAELNDRVVVKIREGKPEYKKKWEAISPHSARRTFASNLFYGWFNKPLPASLCMRYTGHKTEKSFQLYIGASDKELNEKALEYFDFQPQMKVS